MEKLYICWEDVENLITSIVNEIKQENSIPEYIVGLPRGGLIPATIMSHMLDVPLLSLKDIDKRKNNLNILIVDDIADSGKTLNPFTTKYRTATLHYKPQSIHLPTYYAHEVNNDIWVNFPWEKKDSKSIQDYLTNGI
jgi:xanthine phosphoribosyltransferase